MEFELRPLSLGEILDRTFLLYRTRFTLFAGIGAAAAAARLLASALELGVLRVLGASRLAPSVSATGSVLVGGLTLVVYVLATAAMARAVLAVSLGERTSIREAYRTVLPRWLRYTGLSVAAFLLAWWPAVLVYGGFFALLAAQPGKPAAKLPMSVTFLILGLFFIILPLGIWLFMRYTLGTTSAVYEDLGVRAALRRSVGLSKGMRGRIFVLLFMAAILQGILGFALLAPFFGALDRSRGHVSLWLTAYTLMIGFVSTCLASPIYGIGLTLFYLDARVRKEGFDIERLLGKTAASFPSDVVLR